MVYHGLTVYPLFNILRGISWAGGWLGAGAGGGRGAGRGTMLRLVVHVLSVHVVYMLHYVTTIRQPLLEQLRGKTVKM